MRVLSIAFLAALAGQATADDNGFREQGVPIVPRHDAPDNLVSLSVIETWTLPVSQILGLDWYYWEDGYIVFASSSEDRVYRWDANLENLYGYTDTMDTNALAYGVAAGPNGSYFATNDFGNSWMYMWWPAPGGAAWEPHPNPAGSNGRDMEWDHDNNVFWEAATSGSTRMVYRFLYDTSYTTYTLTQPGGQLSGLAVFYPSGVTTLAVTCYSDLHIYFYQFNGSSLNWIGTADCPAVPGLSQSCGLCYAHSRGTMYWSWLDTGGVYHLTELGIGNLGLQPSTWGIIKTLFD
jgi:hypothetical protein